MTKRCFCPKTLGALLGFTFLWAGASFTPAATIWNGPNFTFTKAAFADPTLAANQDRLTANVWITRVSQGGLINAKTETLFTHNISPADTEWAYGDITNALSLTYTTWEQFFGGMAAGGPPTALIGSNTVMHLKTDDIYVAVKLLSWTVGSTSGGGFSYIRSTPGVVPTPAAPLLTNVTLAAGQSIDPGCRAIKTVYFYQRTRCDFHHRRRLQSDAGRQHLVGARNGHRNRARPVSVHRCGRSHECRHAVLSRPLLIPPERASRVSSFQLVGGFVS
jgi:hypothetical protein